MPNHDAQVTPFDQALTILSENGLEGMSNALRILFDEAMRIERDRFLGAGAWQRTDSRRGWANGFKPKTLRTRVGEIELRVPQVRGATSDGQHFYPNALERGVRSERALKLAVAEMYVQGVSTRRVAEVTRDLCGFDVSSSQVSRAAAELDTQLQSWRSRTLGECRYLVLDARYEKVRRAGVVMSTAVLIAIGIRDDGRRSILGVSVSNSEAEVHWRDFLRSLLGRGLHGLQMVVSDDHLGIKAALRATLPSVPWQRCQCHLQRNASQHVPRVAMRADLALQLRSVFGSANRAEADQRLCAVVRELRPTAPDLADWLEENVPEALTVFVLPPSHRRLLRTTNMLERLNLELRRRTRVAGIFPNDESLLRLASAVLSEVSDSWESDRIYLDTQQPTPQSVT